MIPGVRITWRKEKNVTLMSKKTKTSEDNKRLSRVAFSFAVSIIRLSVPQLGMFAGGGLEVFGLFLRVVRAGDPAY